MDISLIFIELGLVIIGLAILTRVASSIGLSAIPFYLIAGLAFGNGGILPLQFSEDFIHVGAEIGIVLLLLHLGLEYSIDELSSNVRSNLLYGLVDLILNFPPGVILGYLLGWSPTVAILLGGITYISSSGVIAKVLSDLGRMQNKETPAIISILVFEDLTMAIYLPVVAFLLIGYSASSAVLSLIFAFLAIGTMLFVVIKYGKHLNPWIAKLSDEVLMFTIFGLVLLVAGITHRLQLSAAVGAFLIGIALSGSVAARTHTILRPLRDLFAAIFFLFFGLQIDPQTFPPVIFIAIGLGLVTSITKFITGWWVIRIRKGDAPQAVRAGATLVARGEFSIIIAGMGINAGIDPVVGTLSAAYIIFLAILGPILARVAEPLYEFIFSHKKNEI